MTSGFAQLSNIHYWQTMPGFQLSKTENCVLTIASRQSTNFLMLRLSSNQSLALAERSTSPALQDYL
jgi:hypothetical protein